MNKLRIMSRYEAIAESARAEGYDIIEDGWDIIRLMERYELTIPEVVRVLEFLRK